MTNLIVLKFCPRELGRFLLKQLDVCRSRSMCTTWKQIHFGLLKPKTR